MQYVCYECGADCDGEKPTCQCIRPLVVAKPTRVLKNLVAAAVNGDQGSLDAVREMVRKAAVEAPDSYILTLGKALLEFQMRYYKGEHN